MKSYSEIFALKRACENRIKKICPNITNESGIYAFLRVDENGIKHAYIGQAKHLLKRCAEHLSGYQYIDLSIKKWGLKSDENKFGYYLVYKTCPIQDLDKSEQETIKYFAEKSYQLKNRTSGSQGKGKTQIAEYRPTKTYRQGIEQGYNNARKEIKALFKYLTVSVKVDNKISQRMLEKFNNFIKNE